MDSFLLHSRYFEVEVIWCFRALQTLRHLLVFFNWGAESEPSGFSVSCAPSHPQLPPGPGIEGSLPSLSLPGLLHHGGHWAFGFFPLSPCTLLLALSPLVATPQFYLFKPVLSPRPSLLTRCLLCSSRFSCSSSRSSPPLPGLLRVAAGLLRALLFQLCGPQQPWPTSRRASSPKTCKSGSTARRKRSAEGGGLRG